MALSGVPLPVFLLVGGHSALLSILAAQPVTSAVSAFSLDRWIQTPLQSPRPPRAERYLPGPQLRGHVLLLWDHWFGSFQEELDEEPPIYGIRGQLRSWNPIWANLHYYAAMAHDCWHARSWIDKLRVWFASPGWRPADVAARFPKPPYDPLRDFARYDPARSLGLSLYALVQLAVLIAANSHFLAVLPKQAPTLNVLYFAFILVSLATIGGILENRREFLFVEAARLSLAGITAVASGAWFGARDPRIILSIASFAVLSLIGTLAIAMSETANSQEESPVVETSRAARQS